MFICTFDLHFGMRFKYQSFDTKTTGNEKEFCCQNSDVFRSLQSRIPVGIDMTSNNDEN